MNDAAPRRIWLCADDYGLADGVNRAIRELISSGRLNATSVMVIGAAIGRSEVAALQDAVANSPRCAVGLHATLTAPFRPLTMYFRPVDGGLFLPFPNLLRRVERLRDSVGADRLMWATDWPWFEDEFKYKQGIDCFRKHAPFFTGLYQHRVIPVAGHNLPQETPRDVAEAVLELVRAT